jgi:hypothetical protein
LRRCARTSPWTIRPQPSAYLIMKESDIMGVIEQTSARAKAA